MAGVMPQTEAEAHREIARWLMSPRALAQAYANQWDEAARASIAASTGGLFGDGRQFELRGRAVRYRFDGGSAGTVKVADLVRIAATPAQRGAVLRLTSALAGLDVVERREPPKPTTPPVWSQWDAERRAAQRLVREAVDAWWTPEPTPAQLDLFATTEGP